MKKFLSVLFVLSISLCDFAQCPFPLTLTMTGHCIKDLHVNSGSPIAQIVICKDGIPDDTIPYKYYLSKLIAGGNGTGAASNQFNIPAGVYLNGSGAVYVSDAGNNRIQKFLPGSTIGITVAGGNGPGNASNQLISPNGLYVDAAGDIYVADQGNNRVQKFLPGSTNGITVAGGNGAGSASNQLDNPSGLFVDALGNIFIADQNNNRVQKWSPGATVGITVAGGNGVGSAANQLNGPTSVFVDGSRNIYVADDNNNRIQKWAPGATAGITVAAGNGPGAGANQLSDPDEVFVDATGNIYVADSLNDRVQEWAPGANQGVTVAGGNLNNQTGAAFSKPTSLYVDSQGNIYVALDAGSNSIQEWSSELNIGFLLDYDPESSGSGSYTALVTDIYGCTVRSNPQIYTGYFYPTVSIAANSTVINPCTPAVFTATPTYGGAAPVYQWQINGKNAGTNDSVFTSTSLQNGDQIICLMTSNDTCIWYPTATSDTITVTLGTTIAALQVHILSSVNAVCQGTPVQFKAEVINGGVNPVFQWQVNGINTGTNDSLFSTGSLENNSIVTCLVTGDMGCQSGLSNSITMTVTPSPVIAPNQSFTFFPGKVLVLDPQVSGDIISYLWTPAAGLSNDTIFHPIANPSKTTYYTLKIVSSDGCQATGNILVKVFTKISVPNAFTPNGDGKNDVFYVLGGVEGAVVKDFSVFDRWGEKVFQVTDVATGDPAFGWNGSFKGLPAPGGTYVYIITIIFSNNTTQVYKGTVVLIR